LESDNLSNHKICRDVALQRLYTRMITGVPTSFPQIAWHQTR
jgi:hypothetical protein